MAILFHTSYGDAEAWVAELRRHFPHDELHVWPDVGPPEEIEFAVAWDIPIEVYGTLPNLRAILLLGSGGSHLRPVEALPPVPIVRLVDDEVANDMATFALHWVIHFQRSIPTYRAQQASATWRSHGFRPTREHTVGVLGFGNIGRHVATAALSLGYPVRGWSSSPKTMAGVEIFTGPGELDAFLADTRTLVNVLPLTPQTHRLLDASRLRTLPAGSSVVNIGRGGTIDDDSLVAALDDDHLIGAALDVFRAEPLGPESPLWAHPKVAITPHVSGAAQPASSVPYIAANIARIRAGEQPFPLFDPVRGY